MNITNTLSKIGKPVSGLIGAIVDATKPATAGVSSSAELNNEAAFESLGDQPPPFAVKTLHAYVGATAVVFAVAMALCFFSKKKRKPVRRRRKAVARRRAPARRRRTTRKRR